MTRFVSLLVTMLLLAGCSQAALMERFIPHEDVAFAKSFLALFPAHDFPAIEAAIDPALHDPQLREKLEQIAALIPTETPQDIRIVGSQTHTINQITTVELTFEYEYAERWLLANVMLQRTDTEPIVTGVHVKPRSESLAQTNRFSLSGKSPLHYVMLAGAIAVPIFILWAAVLAIRTPIPKPKWLWILLVLTGFVQMSLNWTTGDFNVSPVSFQLLGAGYAKPADGPLIITTSIPLGAILFLLRRKSWLVQPEDPPGEG